MVDQLMVNDSNLSSRQVRAARAWLGWSQSDLSMKAGVSHRSIARYELGRSVPYDDTLLKLRMAFERAGITFLFSGASGTGINSDRGD